MVSVSGDLMYTLRWWAVLYEKMRNFRLVYEDWFILVIVGWNLLLFPPDLDRFRDDLIAHSLRKLLQDNHVRDLVVYWWHWRLLIAECLEFSRVLIRAGLDSLQFKLNPLSILGRLGMIILSWRVCYNVGLEFAIVGVADLNLRNDALALLNRTAFLRDLSLLSLEAAVVSLLSVHWYILKALQALSLRLSSSAPMSEPCH